MLPVLLVCLCSVPFYVGFASCLFLSAKLSAAKCHYNVENQELLVVKLALEEWGHWLEGGENKFYVWTDHNTLEFIHGAKSSGPQVRPVLHQVQPHPILSHQVTLSQTPSPDSLWQRTAVRVQLPSYPTVPLVPHLFGLLHRTASLRG